MKIINLTFAIVVILMWNFSSVLSFRHSPFIGSWRSFAKTTSIKSAGDEYLLGQLKEWRKGIANELQKPVYLIFSNKALSNIVAVKPRSIIEFQSIKGIGSKNIRFAEHILPMIIDHMKSNSIENVPASVWSDSIKSPKQPPKPKAKSTYVPKKLQISELNDEKKGVVNLVDSGKNIFLTGCAGTGKSFLTRYLINHLQNIYGIGSVAITAPTGVAAVLIGGQTLHGFSGIGLGKGDTETLVKKVLNSALSVERWKSTRVLVIDEISMLDRQLFELLDVIARRVNKIDKPFGGIQVIVVGDFFQLPPVQSGTDRRFCFQSSLWNSAGFNDPDNFIVLKEIVRQNDTTFVNILNEVRTGTPSEKSLEILNSCHTSIKPLPDDGIVPTKLYCVNKDVNRENLDNLNKLPGDVYRIEAVDVWQSRTAAATKKQLLESMEKLIPKAFDLKIGAQVMLIRNRSKGFDLFNSSTSSKKRLTLVNGSRGVVVAMVNSTVDDSLIPVVRFDNGLEVNVGKAEYSVTSPDGEATLIRHQVPLKLAWSMTVHKSQGATLSRAEILVSNTFDYGQAYVALSRVTSLKGLWLGRNITHSSVKVSQDVLQFMEFLRQMEEKKSHHNNDLPSNQTISTSSTESKDGNHRNIERETDDELVLSQRVPR